MVKAFYSRGTGVLSDLNPMLSRSSAHCMGTRDEHADKEVGV